MIPLHAHENNAHGWSYISPVPNNVPCYCPDVASKRQTSSLSSQSYMAVHGTTQGQPFCTIFQAQIIVQPLYLLQFVW